jgi:hypothetical protein
VEVFRVIALKKLVPQGEDLQELEQVLVRELGLELEQERVAGLVPGQEREAVWVQAQRQAQY